MPSLREKMEFLRPHVAMLGKAAPIVQAMMEWIDKAEPELRRVAEFCESCDGGCGSCFGMTAREQLALLDAPIKEVK